MDGMRRTIHRVGANTHADYEQDEPNFPNKKAKKKPMRKTKKIVLFSLLGALCICIALIALYMTRIANDPASFFTGTPVLAAATAPPAPTSDQVKPVAAGAPTPAPTPTPTVDPSAQVLSAADLEFMKNRVNILVLGLDESVERANWGSFRTDTMILVTVDFETKNVYMISVPRDSYVKIANEEGRPVDQYGKVNSAFPTGGGAQKKGYGYAMGTVSYLLGGIPIQYYVGFNMNVVKDVVNAMGGVDYNVDVQVKMNGRELMPGQQHLDGQAVLDYCRQRKGSSDIARVDRQQRMLMAIFSQLKSTDQIWNIPSIYQAVETNIQTNLNFNQICALAWMAKDMNNDQLQRYTLDGEFMNINSTSYWGLHTNTIQSKVKEIFNIDIRVDSDMSAANVRKAVEEAQALIAGELNSAQGAIRTANRIIGDYGAWIDGNTLVRLETYKAQVEDAMDAGDKALLDAYTAPLRDLNNLILQKLGEAGHNVDSVTGGSNAGTQPPQTPETELPPDSQQYPYDDPGSEIPYIPEEPMG